MDEEKRTVEIEDAEIREDQVLKDLLGTCGLVERLVPCEPPTIRRCVFRSEESVPVALALLQGVVGCVRRVPGSSAPLDRLVFDCCVSLETPTTIKTVRRAVSEIVGEGGIASFPLSEAVLESKQPSSHSEASHIEFSVEFASVELARMWIEKGPLDLRPPLKGTFVFKKPARSLS